jgi:bifunctional non-homologous end joining protein LigD
LWHALLRLVEDMLRRALSCRIRYHGIAACSRRKRMPDEKLRTYRSRRDFGRTTEPVGVTGAGGGNRFVVHKHHATSDRYDLRLELDGVLKSWGVPKGPSLDPAEKRLAVETEDHLLDYVDFEGVIPAGEYGGGPIIV